MQVLSVLGGTLHGWLVHATASCDRLQGLHCSAGLYGNETKHISHKHNGIRYIYVLMEEDARLGKSYKQ